jgi:ATP-dependent Lon protease
MNHQNDFQQVNTSPPDPATTTTTPQVTTPTLDMNTYLSKEDTSNQVSVNQTVPENTATQNTPTPKVSDARDNSLKTINALNPPGILPKKAVDEKVNGDDVIAEIEELDRKVKGSKMPEDLREKAYRSIERLRRMAKRGSYTGEFETVEKYIYWITGIPWGNTSKDSLELVKAKEIMDSSHYGMDVVKNLILDYLAVMQLQLESKDEADQKVQPASADMAVLRGSSANAPVMIFVGLQGVGKTSIAKSIANAMGREFQRVAVGAVGSVSALRGQSKAFLDAEPGQIVKALVRAKTMNPVILLDEIDKASGNSGLLNDIMAALLEILDPEQNATFSDHYIDYPVDLSQVFFVCTANNLGTLSAALLDRMEVIRFTSYTDEEKTIIAQKYTMPKVVKNMAIKGDELIIDDDVWPILVRPVGFDAGLRQLERNISTMVRSAARRIVEGAPKPIHITAMNIREFVLPDQGPLS